MKTNIPFMSYRHIGTVFSILLMVGSIVALATLGLNYGLDFTGGTQVEVAYPEPADVEQVREQLAAADVDAGVQLFGKPTDVLVRIKPQEGEDSAKLGDRVMKILESHNPKVENRRIEFVGPQVGEELRDQSGSAMIFALILMLIYITFRFRFKTAVGAVVALLHDVIIVLGFFAVTQMTFDLTVLAAVLAVIGYSLNDTIVVSDRIRENFRKLRSGAGSEIIDISLNETLGRTLMTSITTLLVLVSLAIFGGELIHSFAIALIVGVGIGTYSSIFVASNIMLMMNISREDFLEQERQEVNDMP